MSLMAVLTVGQAVTLVVSGMGTLRGAVVGEANGVFEVSFAAAPAVPSAPLVPA